MSAQTTFWPMLAIYLSGFASGATLMGLAILARRVGLAGLGAAGRRSLALGLAFLAVFSLTPAVQAQQAQQASAPAAGDPRDDNALAYCRNIANSAADARFARQAAALAAMEKEIEARIAALEAKRAEYQDWLQRRETFLKKADEALIAVISQMRPDAAAAQISVMQDEAAAAILAKLNPRSASAILNEMDPARAATLTNTMVGISRRAQAQAEGRS